MVTVVLGLIIFGGRNDVPCSYVDVHLRVNIIVIAGYINYYSDNNCMYYWKN